MAGSSGGQPKPALAAKGEYRHAASELGFIVFGRNISEL